MGNRKTLHFVVPGTRKPFLSRCLVTVPLKGNSHSLFVVFLRAKLRRMLEWSSLYRVTLLLSKINDDSDLDAEAAILYGKVGRVLRCNFVAALLFSLKNLMSLLSQRSNVKK